ncbi:NADP-dependent oxidoreductase [Streptomyces mayonensis]|uniref:NADP-dependent oxidoreductase n=1 Tax=Streptomyces mayonensis TaxID=2750816 RepID=UPI001C1E1EAE|nr:NADP-dependent oxidoreductase [Streptomyces sp. A108]MBU6529819.1 NADP-dependent oxidoreductase [Streptomyces sp. A108]
MKAVAIDQYGGPDVLRLMDLPEPKVGPDLVLVRVAYAGVNPADWKIREGYIDDWFEAHFPMVMGCDLSGVVERTGLGVTEFAPGDEVIGYVRCDHMQRGTYGELVAVPVRMLAHKPAGLDMREAAGLPAAGLTAHQALRRHLRLVPGEVLLVHAAAGGVGSLAVQLARELGATVIGTASEGNHDYLRSLGALPVTYGPGLAERVRALAPDGVDAVFDLMGGETLHGSPALLRPGGRLASISGDVVALGGRYVFVRPDAADLAELAAMAGRAAVRVHVDAEFPLAEAARAHERVASGHGRGKVVLNVGA